MDDKEELQKLKDKLAEAEQIIDSHEQIARAAINGKISYERALEQFIIDGAYWCDKYGCEKCKLKHKADDNILKKE